VDNGDGTITYTPDPGFSGTDSFTYQVCDPEAACDAATVTITVSSGNQPPVARNDRATTDEDTSVVVNALANDDDPDDGLDPTSVQITAAPANGSVSVNPATGAITYTPDPGFWGTDSYSYQVCDLSGACDTAVDTIRVRQAGSPSPTPTSGEPGSGGSLPGTGETVMPGAIGFLSLSALGLALLWLTRVRGKHRRSLRRRAFQAWRGLIP
jgi:hypothetical protein